MSYDDCLKKLCPDCYKSLDLMDTSLDPQCTACKQRRAREIDDCMAGKKVGQKGGFAKEYYVILYQREWEVIKRGETPPGQHKVVYGPETWGACYDERERLYHEAASGASKKRGP